MKTHVQQALFWRVSVTRDSRYEITSLTERDLPAAAVIHRDCFPRQKHSQQWLACALKAYPRNWVYLAKRDGNVLAYMIWAQKSGFRQDVILELEQIAVSPDYQNQGIACELIQRSLLSVKEQLATRGASINVIIVSTRADNHAQRLYRKALGAEVVASVSGLFAVDEVYMLAKSP